MKHTWKKGIAAMALLAVTATGVFPVTGCGETKTAQTELPEAVENFSLDFETGDFSFDFGDTAKQFYVRIYEQGETDESMPVAARRVRYRSEETSYSGSMDLSELQPGNTYDAYVYTYVKDENGDLIYNTCDSVSGVYHTSYKTPAKNIDCTIEDGTVTVTLENAFFTDQYLDKEPTYLIRFFENGSEISSTELGAADIDEVEETSEGGFGPATTTITRTAETTFEAVDFSAEYGVTVTIISNDESAYDDSAESELIIATEPAAEAEITEETETAEPMDSMEATEEPASMEEEIGTESME